MAIEILDLPSSKMVIFDNDLSLPEAIVHGEIPASKNRAKLEPSKEHVQKIMKPMYSTIFLRRKIWRLLVSKCFKDVDGFPNCHDDTNRLHHWKEQRCIVQGKHPKISQRLSPTSSRISSVINTIPQSTPSPIQNWYHTSLALVHTGCYVIGSSLALAHTGCYRVEA